MLTFHQVTFTIGNKCLLNKASLSLHEKQKIGLIGRNGCGKSSLFNLVLNGLSLDGGEIKRNPKLRISHLAQHLPDSTETALDYVLAGDTYYIQLQNRLENAQQSQNNDEIAVCHGLLEQSGAYTKPAEAAVIMAGLGFKSGELTRSVNYFSGGWRMRLSLARCLMQPADLLLLDEPTNHLDMEAIFWLEKWLQQSAATILLISHDRDFLDSFVSHIVHMDSQQLTLYPGNYSQFERIRVERLALQQKMHEKQQHKIDNLMSFVNRFRAKATKAKQAQSRLNTIAKMETVAKANADSPFNFSFLPSIKVANPLMQCEQLSIGYDQNDPIVHGINLTITAETRVALLGPNGQGKSTLIKTLTGTLTPLSGSLHRANNLIIGYYAQHQLEELDFNLSPLQTITQLDASASEQSIRNFLGGFDFNGDMALSPITNFSGGEKARLALAKLVWSKPNLLLLDEPTNHLDLEMRAAIECALQTYTGALVVISHDRHLLRCAVDDFYLLFDKKLEKFEGDLEDYHQWLHHSTTPTGVMVKDTNSASLYKERKLAQSRLKKIEHVIAVLHREINALTEQLADGALYDTRQLKKLQLLQATLEDTQKKLHVAEQDWMDSADLLEQLQ